MNIVFFILLFAAVLTLFPDTAESKCTDKDKLYTFTACDPITRKRQSVEYYGKACDPNKSSPLRAPITTSCEQQCPSGMYYSPNTVSCTACSPGTISKAETILMHNFNNLPSGVATYCSPMPCEPWTPEDSGQVISSGNQSLHTRRSINGRVDESVTVYLNIIIDVVNQIGGAIKFSYRVESERGFDGLLLFINGTVQENTDLKATDMTALWATGLLRNWRDAKVPLPYGRHDIGFLYVKDRNQASKEGLDVGADRAYLKSIELEGVTSTVDKCTPCPSGKYVSQFAQSQCLECAKDTSSAVGASECTPCPIGQWAPIGSSTCFDRLICQKYDYVAAYSECNTATKKRHQTWHLNSKKCEESKSTTPFSGEVPCARCMVGKFQNEKTGECETCPIGEEWTGAQCKPCAAGTAAIPILNYDEGFDSFGGQLPEEFATMSCIGDCPSGEEKPFSLASYPTNDFDHSIIGIRQSHVSGSSYTSILKIPFEMVSDGSAEVYYAFYHPKESTDKGVPNGLSGFVTLDGYDYPFDTTKFHTRDSEKRATITIPYVKRGKYVLHYTVRQDERINPIDMVDVVLLGIKLVGEKRGGVPKCTKCPIGHYCPAKSNRFEPCEPGHYMNELGATKCNKCANGFATGKYGSENCEFCTVGTRARDDGTMCENTCNISFFNYVNYDLTPLRGKVFGPLLISNSEIANNNMSIDDLDAHNVNRFYVSPCSLMNTTEDTNSPCSAFQDKDTKNAFVCQRLNKNRSNNLGTNPDFSEFKTELVLKLSGGDTCTKQNGEIAARRSLVTFKCDPTNVPGSMKYVNENPTCQYNFVISSRYGCPVCLPSSYMEVKSDCNKETGNITINYYKKEWISNCVPGYEPKPHNVSCHVCEEDNYERVWSDCINNIQEETYVLKSQFKNCINNPDVNFTTRTRRCRKLNANIGVNPFTIGILFFLGIIILMSIVLFIIYKRHNRLRLRYQLLATHDNSDGVMEMITPSHEEDNSCFDEDSKEELYSNNNNKTNGKVTAPPPLE